MEDYKDEYLLRLNKSLLYQELKLRCTEKDNEVIALVDSCVSFAFQRTKTIIKHMGEFTLHDGDHLFRVLNLMELLLPEENIKNLSPPELMLLIISAFFHDIGMAPEEKDILAWKKVWDSNPNFSDNDEERTFEQFKRFYSARPEQQEFIRSLILQGKNSSAETLKGYFITEFIRQTHAERAREIIDKHWNGVIKFRDNDLTVELAQICYSHNEDALSLLELDKNYLCGLGIVACLPLIGVILRLSDILDFDGKRTPSILYSHLYVRHPISIQEWNKHRAVEAWDISPDIIQYTAKCSHPAIEASIHEFCDIIDHELSLCNNIASNLNEFNKNRSRDITVKFPFKVNREKIRAQKNIQDKPLYIYRQTKFNLSKKQVIDLLMGTKLYGNPEVALRELLQNSIDACLLRKAQEEKWGNLYDPKITIKYYTDDKDDILEIIDNGTGMDQYIIDNYYSKVGSSFYKSTDFYNLKAETNADFQPTSRFGIGILSCFMVADTLIVDTKRVYAPHKSSEPLNLTVEGQDSIFWIKIGTREIPGTTTKLILRKSKNPWDKMDEDDFIKSVENVVPNPPFIINIETNKEKRVIDQYSFEKVSVQSLKDFTWNKNENVDTYEIALNHKENGIVGSVIIAVLVENDVPTKKIEINSKDIEIDGNTYSLEKRLELWDGKIVQNSTSITINDESEIKQDTSMQYLSTSKSQLSLHGIIVPSTLFPESWRMKKNQAKLSWPLPLIAIVDVCGNNDLELNSSRTEVLMGDKWINFEELFAFLIFDKLANMTTLEYWEKLKQILIEESQSEPFTNAITKIVRK
ncbi:MAG: ATP-binding protein [Bacteroidetes bacterium]|nr:ATP-binding protein [Bacteroidota bacterium]